MAIFKSISNKLNWDMSAEFEGTLVKWGTSLGLAIPKPIRDGMNLKAGDKIKILLRQNMICIKKVE